LEEDILTKGIPEYFEDEYFWLKSCSNGEDESFFSSNVYSITGFTSDEMLSLEAEGKNLVISEDKEPYLEKICNFEKDISNTELSLDYRISKKDGETVWVNEKIKVIRDDSGKITKWVGRVEEISGKKQAEEKQNKLITRLNELNSAKDKFLSSLSHNLRSPFTSILGFAEILMNEPVLSAKDKEDYISYIYNSSENLLKLINSLLEWSRLQNGKTRVNSKRLNAQTIVYSSVSSLTRSAIRKNIEIKVNVPDSITVLADERLFGNVITALLNNAIKFSESEKTIEVSASVFNEELIEFVIRDEGIGIPEEEKTQLFKIENLFSTDGTHGEKGNGLGLILAKEIVEKHKGQLWFYSEVGKGSEFHFTVPISINTILLIENNKEDRKSYEEIIKEVFPSFRLISASNAYEAINNFSGSPLLIITSHEIPFMNGLKLIENICKDEKEMIRVKRTIMVLANELSPELKSAYDEFGQSIFLQKPLDLKQFSAVLKKLFK
jgi:PAS domain S-box-containing protein